MAEPIAPNANTITRIMYGLFLTTIFKPSSTPMRLGRSTTRHSGTTIRQLMLTIGMAMHITRTSQNTASVGLTSPKNRITSGMKADTREPKVPKPSFQLMMSVRSWYLSESSAPQAENGRSLIVEPM